jgi:hypothetical protein
VTLSMFLPGTSFAVPVDIGVDNAVDAKAYSFY